MRRSRSFRLWGLGALFAVVAVACGGGGGGEGAAPPPEEEVASPAEEERPTADVLTGEGEFDWQVLEVDRGVKPDLALDDGGRAHIAYGLEAQPGFVKHAVVTDETAISTVAEGYFYFPLEIALDADGTPLIAWHNHDVEDQAVALAADADGSAWEVLRTESPNHDGWDNSLAIDAEGRPHTVAVDPSGFQSDVGLEYAVLEGDTWTVEEVGTGPLMYEFGTSVAIAEDGTPHALYYDDRAGELMHAVRENSSWAISPADTDGDAGRFSDLLIDGDGRLRAAYLTVTGEAAGTVRYAIFDGSEWVTEDVDDLENLFLGPPGNLTGARNVVSIALDSQGTPVIAYSDQQEVRLARKAEGGWETETVLTADADPLGQTVSLALGEDDVPQLATFVATDLSTLDGRVLHVRGMPKGA